jgi:hypothetical protein
MFSTDLRSGQYACSTARICLTPLCLPESQIGAIAGCMQATTEDLCCKHTAQTLNCASLTHAGVCMW